MIKLTANDLKLCRGGYTPSHVNSFINDFFEDLEFKNGTFVWHGTIFTHHQVARLREYYDNLGNNVVLDKVTEFLTDYKTMYPNATQKEEYKALADEPKLF